MWGFIKPNKVIVAITVFLCIISSVMYALVSIFLQRILDSALTFNVDYFVRELIVAVIFFLAILVLVFFYHLLVAKSILHVLITIRKKMYRGIAHSSVSQFQKKDTSEYLSMFNNDLKIIEDNYFYSMFTLCENVTLFIASLVIMFYYSPIIAIITALSILLMVVVPMLVGRPLEKKQTAYSNQLSLFTEKLKDILLGFEVIKTYNMEKREEALFLEENNELMKVKYRVDWLGVISGIVSITLALIMQVGVIGLAAYFVLKGNITVGALLALTQLGSALAQPLMSIFVQIPKVKSTKQIIQKICTIANDDNEQYQNTHQKFEHAIVLSDVSFGYDENKKIFQNISVTIVKGKKYAIIGGNGSGKSTFIKLVSGYFTNYEGAISIDGVALTKAMNSNLFQIISIIHQNTFLFNDTIQNNICLYEAYPEEHLHESIQKSGLADMITNKKLSLDTVVRENGQNLSGGQRQRIAIARALLRKKPILILDESTSAMEQKTGYDIEQKLLTEENLTLLVITHKLEAKHLRDYDQLIVLDHGKIGEVGTFDELMMKQEILYHMIEANK